MNQAELITAISDGTDFTKADAKAFIEVLGEVAQEQLAAGNEVTLSGIGKLKPKHRPARTGRNPKTGGPVDIPAKTTVVLSVSKDMADKLN